MPRLTHGQPSPLTEPPSRPIALVMPIALRRGGCETMLMDLLHANRAGPGEDYRVCFLEDGPMIDDVRGLGYVAHVVAAGRLRQGRQFVAAVRALRQWFDAQGVVHALSWMEKAHLYTGPAAALAGISTSWWLHSIDPNGRMMRLINAIPTRHVFTSSRAAGEAWSARNPRRPISVCHCGIDLRRFSPDNLPSTHAARRALGLSPVGPLVGIVARLQRWKGIDVFIDAAARLIKAGSATNFVIVGGEHALEADVKPELEARIRTLGVDERVRLVGFQSDIPMWMQACDVIVHASTGVEPFGIVVIEALALAKVVIAAKAGGPLEIIQDGVNGRLTPPGDAHALADAIAAGLPDTPQNAAMRAAARRRALEFGGDRLAAEVSRQLRSIVAEKASSSPAGRPPSPGDAAQRGPVRVGLVMPLAVRRGGCETQLINLLTASRHDARIDYVVCFLEYGPMVDEVRALGYAAHVIDARRLRQLGRYVTTVRQLTQWMRDQRVTRVISWMEKAHLYAAPAAWAVGIPAAWWLRSIDPSSTMLTLINLLPADRMFVCSRAALSAFEPILRDRSTTVCHSAVDLGRFDPQTLPRPAEARRRLGLPPDRPIVGIVGRLQRWKGVDVFIAAAARVRPSAGAYFVVLGGEHKHEPDVLAELRGQAERLGIARHFHFAGYQHDVPLWMQACDVIVHASTRPEPLGIVVAEAMALGKSVIAADEAGPREIVTDGVDGRLTTPGDAAALATAIDGFLVDSEDNRRLRRAARRRAADFSAAGMADCLARALARGESMQAAPAIGCMFGMN